MSYVHAIDGLRSTIENFVVLDGPRMREEIGERESIKATAGLMALLQNGEHYVQIVADHLRRAEPVYWSPEMCDMLARVQSGIPDWTLRMSDLVTESGFAWFSKPLELGVKQPMADGQSIPLLLAGMLWGVVLFTYEPEMGDRTRLGYRQNGDGAEPWIVYCPVVLLDHEPRLCGGASWAEGESLSELLIGPQAKSETDLGQWATAIGKCFATTMALMDQHIVTADKVTLPRSDRRRLDREGWVHDSTIRVVKLRRATTGHANQDGDRTYELTCQFVVRGHWRNQYYPSTDEHRPLFILPYIKGDPTHPFKTSADRVFEMTR